MPKLILTVGLPRSGKTTWARSTGLPIVNPDSIRLALHDQRFFAPAEPFLWAIAYLMADALLKAGAQTVVVDATNVTAKRREEWARIDAAYELQVFETSPAECTARAKAVNDETIIPVIESQAREWDLPIPESWNL